MNKNTRNILLLLVFIIGIILATYFFKSKYEEHFDTNGIVQSNDGYTFYPNTKISKDVKDIIILDISGSDRPDGHVNWTNYEDFKRKCNGISNCIGFSTDGYFFKDSVNIIDSSFVITPYYSYLNRSDKTIGFYMRTQIPTMPTTLTKKRLDEINGFFTSVEKQVKCASQINGTQDVGPPPDQDIKEYIETINTTITAIEKNIIILENLIPPQLTFNDITEGNSSKFEILGNPPIQKINLTLMKGPSGPSGPMGSPGATGDQGLQGSIGERGTTGTYATAYNPNIR